MPGPSSSNELLTELLRELLAERAQDQREGLTLRSLDRRVTEHSAHDDRLYDRLEERLRRLETQQAHTEGHDELHTPAVGFPPVPVAINLGSANSQRARHSSFPALPGWMKRALKPAAHWATMLLIAVAVHLLGRCNGTPTQAAPSVPPTSVSPR